MAGEPMQYGVSHKNSMRDQKAGKHKDRDLTDETKDKRDHILIHNELLSSMDEVYPAELRGSYEDDEPL